MLARAELLKIARARLKDAQSLFAAGRYDGSLYMCGYAFECALKARIVSHLMLAGFPETGQEFERVRFLKTHDFETLLILTGRKDKIRANYIQLWAAVIKWQPETRYAAVGTVNRPEAEAMINSAAQLLKVM